MSISLSLFLIDSSSSPPFSTSLTLHTLLFVHLYTTSPVCLRRSCASVLHAGLLPPRPLSTVEWLACRVASGHRTATPQLHAMNASAAGRQRRSVYSGSIALTSSRFSRCSVQGTGLALYGLSVPGVTCKIPRRDVRCS